MVCLKAKVKSRFPTAISTMVNSSRVSQTEKAQNLKKESQELGTGQVANSSTVNHLKEF